jgi:hypothetical protein
MEIPSEIITSDSFLYPGSISIAPSLKNQKTHKKNIKKSLKIIKKLIKLNA